MEQFKNSIDQFGHLLGLEKYGVDPLAAAFIVVVVVVVTICVVVQVKSQSY